MRIIVWGETGHKDRVNKWIYDPRGIAPTLMAGGSTNPKTKTNQGQRRIWVIVPDRGRK